MSLGAGSSEHISANRNGQATVYIGNQTEEISALKTESVIEKIKHHLNGLLFVSFVVQVCCLVL